MLVLEIIAELEQVYQLKINQLGWILFRHHGLILAICKFVIIIEGIIVIVIIIVIEILTNSTGLLCLLLQVLL